MGRWTVCPSVWTRLDSRCADGSKPTAPALSAAILASLDHLRPWMPWVAIGTRTPRRADRADRPCGERRLGTGRRPGRRDLHGWRGRRGLRSPPAPRTRRAGGRLLGACRSRQARASPPRLRRMLTTAAFTVPTSNASRSITTRRTSPAPAFRVAWGSRSPTRPTNAVHVAGRGRDRLPLADDPRAMVGEAPS